MACGCMGRTSNRIVLTLEDYNTCSVPSTLRVREGSGPPWVSPNRAGRRLRRASLRRELPSRRGERDTARPARLSAHASPSVPIAGEAPHGTNKRATPADVRARPKWRRSRREPWRTCPAANCRCYGRRSWPVSFIPIRTGTLPLAALSPPLYLWDSVIPPTMRNRYSKHCASAVRDKRREAYRAVAPDSTPFGVPLYGRELPRAARAREAVARPP